MRTQRFSPNSTPNCSTTAAISMIFSEFGYHWQQTEKPPGTPLKRD